MIDWLKKTFFSDNEKNEEKPNVNLAAAALLLEVAKADFDTDDRELQEIAESLKPLFSLTDADISALLTQAKVSIKEAVDLHGYTRLLNELYNQPQKIEFITLMWKVAMSDGALHKYEDSLIRKTADLLHVSHSDFMRTKKAAQVAYPDYKAL
jgi:uncharacterized tellurite resistance protein B-like protein